MEAKLTRESPEAMGVDAVVVPLLEGERLSRSLAALDKALGGTPRALMSARRFRAEFGQRALLHTLGRIPARQVLLLGLGKRKQLDLFRIRNAFQESARALKHEGAETVGVWAGDALTRVAPPERAVQAVVEGTALANFEMGEFKTRNDEPLGQLTRVVVAGLDGARAMGAALSEALVVAEACNLVRSWANHPANAFTPTVFAQRAREVARKAGLEIRVLERRDMEREGMGSLLGVARGSDEPPKLIVLRYRPPGRGRRNKLLALAGKGITFDSGGISIKPAEHMEMMKHDMAGGAAVIGAMYAIGRLKPAVDVLAVVAATENLPSGKALKPGDVVRASNGKTIEIINTDAEGRLVLADAVAWAVKQGATHIVDVATLTGAVMIALGHVATGIMGNDPAFLQLVQRAAERAGERVWPLPLFPEYDFALRSEIADIKNAGGRWGGAINGALFIREFVADRPWVHLDIAGTAWNDQGELRQIPQGPSGSAVGTMVQIARLLAS